MWWVLYAVVTVVLFFVFVFKFGYESKKMTNSESLIITFVLCALWLPSLIIIFLGLICYLIYLAFGGKLDEDYDSYDSYERNFIPSNEVDDDNGVDYEGNEDMCDADEYDIENENEDED